MTNNQPIHEIRFGRIKATFWSNETANGPRINVTVSRLYKKDDKWEQTQSFSRNDLPVVAKVLNQAFTYLLTPAAEREPETYEVAEE